MAKYEVYYMDNDRQKKIVGTNLKYWQAVKLSQQYATDYNIDADYKAI